MRKIRVKAIYDNGGATFDRYTVYFNVRDREFWTCLAMSAEPFHPQGFGQHSVGSLGRHNGKRITFEQLPTDCQKAIVLEIG